MVNETIVEGGGENEFSKFLPSCYGTERKDPVGLVIEEGRSLGSNPGILRGDDLVLVEHASGIQFHEESTAEKSETKNPNDRNLDIKSCIIEQRSCSQLFRFHLHLPPKASKKQKPLLQTISKLITRIVSFPISRSR